MPNAQRPHDKKGTFGRLRLPVAKTYLEPASRRWLILAGAILAATIVLYAAFDLFLGKARFISNGPLSSSHAAIESDCASCHEVQKAVTPERCSTCHEKHGDRLGVYTWAAHYLYRSNDFQRVVPSPGETGCASCHLEHRGREAELTRVADAACLTCHEAGSFNDGHPPFDFAAEAIPDDDALTFPHISHVRELMKREALVDVERACLYCHQAESDGKGFQPIAFDQHCDTCHLTTAIRTPTLPIEGSRGKDPGVLPFETFRDSGEPGTHWALFTSSREFRERGAEISKSPVYHEDPWILANLRRLRHKIYPDGGLADLLKSSADVPPRELPKLYEEAIATLESYALGLRSSDDPAIQRDLRKIEQQLAKLRRAVRDPYTPLDETKLTLALEGGEAELSAEEKDAIEALVNDLTAVCQQCHRVEKATIVRTSGDLRVLDRAHFDHRAHILERRCLDCHTRIPIEEALAATSAEDVEPFDQAFDQAAIQNLPAIEVCQQCHNPRLAANSCTTCHFFHPNKSRRSAMLLYLEEE